MKSPKIAISKDTNKIEGGKPNVIGFVLNIKAIIPKIHMFAKLLPKTLPITTSCFLYLNIASNEVNISGEDEAKAKYIEPINEEATPRSICSFNPVLTRNSEPTAKRDTPRTTRIMVFFVEKIFVSCFK